MLLNDFSTRIIFNDIYKHIMSQIQNDVRYQFGPFEIIFSDHIQISSKAEIIVVWIEILPNQSILLGFLSQEMLTEIVFLFLFSRSWT